MKGTVMECSDTNDELKALDVSFWEDFMEEVFQQRYVLVLGSEAMLQKDCFDGDSEKYWDTLAFEKRIRQKDDFRKVVKKNPIKEELFNQDLYSLLSTKLFRIVMTTTVDDLLEREMRKIWGDELIVLDFYGGQKRADIEIKRNQFDEIPPILYYAFGKVDSDFVYYCNEDDKLKVVADWLNHDKNNYPKNFYSHLSALKLLAIGCKQSDWLFRFFWYSLGRSVRTLGETVGGTKGLATVALELGETEESLKEYLENKEWLYEGGMWAFIRDFLRVLNLESKNATLGNLLELKEKIDARRIGHCFISYSHNDWYFALNLYLRLKKDGCNVWLDNEKLHPGDNYNKDIEQAIEQCSVFIPILSSDVYAHYDNGEWAEEDKEEPHYYRKEWHMAVKMGKRIIPVLRNVSVMSDAYQHTPWVIKGKDSTVCVLNEIDSYRKLKEGIKRCEEI